MLFVPTALLTDRIKEAAAILDSNGVRLACEDLIAGIRNDPSGFDAGMAGNVLRALRSKRYFVAMEEVARAAIEAGGAPPVVRRHLCQSLVDQGKTLAAVTELNRFEAETSGDPKEHSYALGLLGRAYKQIYVDGRRAGISAEDLAPLLATACRRYNAGYNESHVPWHIINVIACLHLARADGVRLTMFPDLDEKELAATLLAEIEQRGDAFNVWDCTNALQACVELGRTERAFEWARRLTSSSAADAFELGATFRQLTELYGLAGPGAPPEFNPLVSNLLEALLRRDAGSHELTVHRETREVLASMGDFERTFQDGTLVAIKWFRDALSRCQGVGRVENAAGVGLGTGFLVRARDLLGEGVGHADGFLFVTNAHVVSDDPRVVQKYKALRPDAGPTVVFEERGGGSSDPIEIARLLWTSPPEELDYTVLELATPSTFQPPFPLARELPECDGKQAAWVLGHPKGGKLSVSMKNNLVVGVSATRLHYRSATEPGSSGSPVFNDLWQLIGLHHYGGTLHRLEPGRTEETYEANEGIALRAIVADVEKQRTHPPVPDR